MQILVAVRHDLCFPMPFHSAQSVQIFNSNYHPFTHNAIPFFDTLALLAQLVTRGPSLVRHTDESINLRLTGTFVINLEDDKVNPFELLHTG